jgi:hypothetical protein
MQNYELICCETWSIILREEHRQRMVDKMVLRRIYRKQGEAPELESRNTCTIFVRKPEGKRPLR